MQIVWTGVNMHECQTLFLGKRKYLKMKYFSYFPRKQVLTFRADFLRYRQFTWNVKSRFLQKSKKTISKYVVYMYMSSAEISTQSAQR